MSGRYEGINQGEAHRENAGCADASLAAAAGEERRMGRGEDSQTQVFRDAPETPRAITAVMTANFVFRAMAPHHVLRRPPEVLTLIH